ncbi:hypothetical protein PybrP1_001916 [[Pythium] brassicae (nom. inval.)]|nr:hypothetical protein PybrP1_001916 [[Pythium] brassicae (nom. inval.)]
MREHVQQLKKQYALALAASPTASLSDIEVGDGSSSNKGVKELYAELARVREQLLEESAALQQMLAEQNALGSKIHQLQQEFQGDLATSAEDKPQDDETHYMSPPMSADECRHAAASTYAAVQHFMQSKSFLSTGAAAFGWRDRRRLEGGRLQFSLQKRFAHAAPHALAQRSWELFTSCTQHAALYTSSLHVRFYVPQVVDAHNFVALREFSTPVGDVVAKSLFLISRLHTERGPAILFRSADKARLRTRYDGGFAGSELREDEQPVQWLQDVITWVVFSESGDDCVLDFGGDIPGTADYAKEVWMLEVLLIALRWESMVSGPLFAIAD